SSSGASAHHAQSLQGATRVNLSAYVRLSSLTALCLQASRRDASRWACSPTAIASPALACSRPLSADVDSCRPGKADVRRVFSHGGGGYKAPMSPVAKIAFFCVVSCPRIRVCVLCLALEVWACFGAREARAADPLAARLEEARVHLQRGRFEEAIEAYDT